MKKNYFLIIGILILLLVGGYFGMQKFSGNDDEVIVEKGDIKSKASILKKEESIQQDKMQISTEKITEGKIDYRNVKFYKLDNQTLLVQVLNGDRYSKYINGNLLKSISDEENIISFDNNSLLTELVLESEKTLKIYNYNTLNKEFSLFWKSENLHNTANVKKINDYIFVDNFMEGYGTSIIGKNYSTGQVQEVLKDDGFTTFLESGSTILVQKTKGGLYLGTIDKELLKQKYFDNKLIDERIKDFFEFELGYIFYSSSKDNKRNITALDFEGNVMWQKQKNLPYFNKGFDIIENKDNILLFTSINEVELVNKYNGEEVAKLSLFNQKLNTNLSKIRVLDFLTVDNNIFLLTGEYIQSKNNIHDINYENVLISEFSLSNYKLISQNKINHLITGGALIKNEQVLKLFYY